MTPHALIEKYDFPVPRYTSFPTANHFHDNITQQDVRSWLAEVPNDKALSLYIHIPFCLSMCRYCGCFTRVSGHYRPISKFISTLIDEIKLVAGLLGHQRQVSSIHFGGGTPTVINTRDMARLFEVLDTAFQRTPGCEVAIEIDPRTLEEEKAFTLAHWGIHRASLGIQDTNAKVQEAIGRVQPDEIVEKTLAKLTTQGVRAINMDLIYGLPCQTLDTITQTATQVSKWRPGRISLFGYAHVPWMRPHQQQLEQFDLPDPFLRAQLFERASDILCENGYVPIGMDHFALPEDSLARALEKKTLRRNFQGYTTDQAETLIAFGLSGISQYQEGFAQNSTSLREYQSQIEKGDLPVARGYKIKSDDIFYARIIEELMCYGQVDLNALCKRFDKPLNTLDFAKEGLDHLQKDGLCSYKEGRLTLLPKGRLFQRLVASCFDPYFEKGVRRRHAQAV